MRALTQLRALQKDAYCLRAPVPLGRAVKQRVREAWCDGTWKMTYRYGLLRPPERVQPEEENPVFALGECSRPGCLMSRLETGCEDVRRTLVQVLAMEIEAALPQFFGRGATEGAVYCTLASGSNSARGLYFDWELLEVLLRKGMKLKSIWLLDDVGIGVEESTTEKDRISRATENSAFARWFADVEGLEVHAFPGLESIKEWIAAFPEVGRAHMAIVCDQEIELKQSLCEAALAKDGLFIRAGPSRYTKEKYERLVVHDGKPVYRVQEEPAPVYSLLDFDFKVLKTMAFANGEWADVAELGQRASWDPEDFLEIAEPLNSKRRELTRKQWQDGWSLTFRDGRMRPPLKIQGAMKSFINPLADLGECAEKTCPFSRCSTTSFPPAQPAALDFLVDEVLGQFEEDAAPATYLSLGSGSLYLDWELLESLINLENMKFKSIWLVDWCYNPEDLEYDLCAPARYAFTSWFSDIPGLQIYTFPDAESLQEWVKAHPEAGKADIVMRYDAKHAEALVKDPTFRQDVVADGALFLEGFLQEQAASTATSLMAMLDEGDEDTGNLFTAPVLRSSVQEGGDLVTVKQLVGLASEQDWLESVI